MKMDENDPCFTLNNMLVNASYHDHQEYIWFMGWDLDHFQDYL